MTKTKTTAAICASAIRAELKKAFPNVKFSVKSANFANGDSVHIDYVDGIARKDVEAITNKYQYGHFDGMIDCYEHSNTRDDLPAQAKFVFVTREFSVETSRKLMLKLAEKYGIAPQEDLSKNFEWNDKYTSFAQLIWKEYNEVEVV